MPVEDARVEGFQQGPISAEDLEVNYRVGHGMRRHEHLLDPRRGLRRLFT
jgi:hypothetical protein